MRALIDASTAVSGLLFEGNEATLLELGRSRAVTLLLITYTYEEVASVLRRSEFQLTEEEVEGLLRHLSECTAITVSPTEDEIQANYSLLIDKKDLPVAVASRREDVDALVTGDGELLGKVPKATRTRALLERILG